MVEARYGPVAASWPRTTFYWAFRGRGNWRGAVGERRRR